jgi:hypothetical protein
MAHHPNSADMLTVAGGVAKTFGALNLDKQWGAFAIVAGVGFDALDGHHARTNGLEDGVGAAFDTSVDRVTEGIVVASLVEQDIVPCALPIIGYVTKLALKTSGRDGNTAGNIAAICKDAAIGIGILATCFNRQSKERQFLKTSTNVLGWIAVGIGVGELIT